MSTPRDGTSLRATVHLVQQATIAFTADRLWPAPAGPTTGGAASGTTDLDAFTGEVMRRLQVDGWVGFRAADDAITVVPFGAVKRVDVAVDRG